jgi:hypothetical protein
MTPSPVRCWPTPGLQAVNATRSTVSRSPKTSLMQRLHNVSQAEENPILSHRSCVTSDQRFREAHCWQGYLRSSSAQPSLQSPTAHAVLLVEREALACCSEAYSHC